MIRLILGGLVLLFSTATRASDCYYYWSHQCVEIIDASKRQLQQTLLISPSVNYFNSGTLECHAAATQRQETLMVQLLEAFNATAGNFKACDTPLDSVSLRVFSEPGKATWHYNRTRRPGDSKTLVTVDNLPLM
ncbi:hypothetical protein MWU49_07630 [Alcanivorax sp. S6407]|uniref:hypothetical protein n=1 Tax=Alcanivorax sp. S6407 TaxID=2926424 RepID=UPI001FF4DD45|nr:hypothetical protein [Alcanivorax sp. S6407]MCK0153567.1 hypothetical protein [Alcanivorax sp. S6407]